MLPDETGYGWQRIVGGYKLYDNEEAHDRWFFNLAVELPYYLLNNEEILYQYITFEDEDQRDYHTGALACKVQIGDPALSVVDQWMGLTDLNSQSADIEGKTWYEQLAEFKMAEPVYKIYYDNEETVALVPSEREDYSI